jgi:hypothetical protein
MATASALVLLNACSDNRGLSAARDGSAGSTGGATAGAGGSTPGTGGSQTGTGGTSATGGATMTAGSGSGGLTGTGGKVGGAGGSAIDAGTIKDAGRDVICPPVCDLYCPAGYRTDSNGCELCECKPAPVDAGRICPGVCAIYCPYGNVLDDNGCATCTCNPPPADAGPRPTDAGLCPSPVCPPIVCEYGYANDPNGCPTCKCNPAPNECPAIKCRACPFGYLKDDQGCDTCDCAPDPGKACADITNESTCAATTDRCRWLVPGCSDPALPAAGCYDKTFIDCTTSCPSGRSCLQRSINPCYNLDCMACSQQIGICL